MKPGGKETIAQLQSTEIETSESKTRPQRTLYVENGVELMEVLEDRIEVVGAMVLDGHQLDTIAEARFNPGSEVKLRRSETVIKAPRSGEENVAHGIQGILGEINILARDAVVSKKAAEFWSRDDIQGGKHKVYPFKLKSLIAKAKLLERQWALERMERQVGEEERVPTAVAQEYFLLAWNEWESGELITLDRNRELWQQAWEASDLGKERRIVDEGGLSSAADSGERGAGWLGRAPWITSLHAKQGESVQVNDEWIVRGLLLTGVAAFTLPMIVACGASEQPVVIEATPTSTLSQPGLGVTVNPTAEPTQKPEVEPVEPNNFGLNGDNGDDWPGVGVETVSYVQGLVSQGIDLELAHDMTGEEKEMLKELGGDVDGLVDEMTKKLNSQGNNNYSTQPVVGGDGTWAIEVRPDGDKDSSRTFFWSRVKLGDGSEKLWDHPNFIPSSGDFTFTKLDPEEIGLQDGERLELAVREGKPVAVVVNNSGEKVGIFDPAQGAIERVQLQVQPTEEVETALSVAVSLGYTEEECADCVIEDVFPQFPGVRKELWSEVDGIKGFWTEEGGWESTEGWADVLNNEVYWGDGFNYRVIRESPERDRFWWRGVFDGTSIKEPYTLTDSQGVIFENKFSTFFYYLDNQDRLVAAIVPYVVTVNGEAVVLNGTDDLFREVYGFEEAAAVADKLEENIVKGKSMHFILRLNAFVPEGKKPWGEWSETIRNLWNRYQETYSEEYQRFLDTGEPPSVAIPLINGGDFMFNEKFVTLP